MLEVDLEKVELRSGRRCRGRACIDLGERLDARRLTVTLLAFRVFRRPFPRRPAERSVTYAHTVELASGPACFRAEFPFDLPVPGAEAVTAFGRRPSLWTRVLHGLASRGPEPPLDWALEARLERHGKGDVVREVPLQVELRRPMRSAS